MEQANTIFGVKVEFTAGDKEVCLAHCTNFLTLQDYCMDMTEDTLLKCILVEKQDRNRSNILGRLFARYGKLRHEREKRELYL